MVPGSEQILQCSSLVRSGDCLHILVINDGSSSVKASVFCAEAGGDLRRVMEGEASGLGTDAARMELRGPGGEDWAQGIDAGGMKDVTGAVTAISEAVSRPGRPKVDAVGYRVVHPGARLKGHQRATPEVMEELRRAEEFAPLHDPAAVATVEEMMRRLPGAGHFLCFDTVFHETMPEVATTYALPRAVRDRGVRRYGFHGLSCESVVRQMRASADRGEMAFPRRMILAHLGSGCSVTAVVGGESLDNSMGLTPDGGVVMGTRPGDLDPGVVLWMLRQETGDLHAAVSRVEGTLNRDAGVHAISEMPNDVRAVRETAAKGNAQARLALRIFTRSVKKTLAGYVGLMGGVDALVFAGGIGEHDAASRQEIVEGLGCMGITIDAARNSGAGKGIQRISADGATAAVYVVPAEEEMAIAGHVWQMSQQP